MHEKIFKNEDGSKVKVKVRLYINQYRPNEPSHEYQFTVMYCEPKKRSFVMAKKDQYTSTHLQETANEYWNSLKPNQY